MAAILPYGKVTPVAVKGGLYLPDGESGKKSVIVNAGVIV